MPKFKDRKGQKIGRLQFIDFFKKNNEIFWKIKCDCNLEFHYSVNTLSRMTSKGKIFECKQCKLKRRLPIELNSKFGRLTIIKEIPSKYGHARWFRCLCECGNYLELPGKDLTRKRRATRSCGCWMRKIHSKWANLTQYPPAHGFKENLNIKTLTFNLYNIRNSTLRACYNKNDVRYKNHGEKGHTMCDLWRNGAKEFVKWALENGYKKGKAIILKDGKLEYNPENCKVICKNILTKKRNSKFIEYIGEKKSITDWSIELGCSFAYLSNRLKKYKNYPIEKIMDLNWHPD